MKKRIHILEPEITHVGAICGHLKCHPFTAAILVNRNLTCPESVDLYLKGGLKHLRSPMSMPGMKQAVERIARGILKREHILIFGDYDVDGVTATTILFEFLKYAGAVVSYYIPHRTEEGYDLKSRHIQEVAVADDVDLIVTVDCGSNSCRAIHDANQHGIDVIVTDHHHITDSLPDAVSVINPKACGCPDGFRHLAGVGVAFILLIGLRMHLRDIGFWQKLPEPNLKQYCDLVALGTVADLVPLREENRLLVKAGMDMLKDTRRHGLKALSAACGLRNTSCDTDDIAFRLAPRLNAAGRMQHAETAVELLMTSDEETARKLAVSLCLMNQQRQEMEKLILDDIEHLKQQAPSWFKKKSLVLDSKNWHEGILGIVASRLVSQFHRPVVLISTRGGIGKGSCRSIPGLDLHMGLCRCGDCLLGFGGHAMAAGLTLHPERIQEFRARFEDYVQEQLNDTDLTPQITVDLRMSFDDITENLIDELERLRPFGPENPEPLFLTENLRIVDSKIVGEQHRRMLLCQADSLSEKKITAFQFHADPLTPPHQTIEWAVFRLRWNRWNGTKQAQMIIEDLEYFS